MNSRIWHPLWARLGIGFCLILFLSVLWLTCAAKVNLITADLGRHIKNGALFVQSHEILSTNFYSYTQPDFLTICHHWGSGVLFFLVHQLGGFLGLSIFYTAILFITGALLFVAAWRLAGFFPALLTGMLALPLIAYRLEIRPEGLTTLFVAIEFIILWFYRARLLSGRWLWALPFIQLVWINTHILFFIGFALMSFFMMDAFILDRRGKALKELFFVAITAAAVSLVNPFGLTGLLEPLNIFREYAYLLVENQTVFFMLKRFPGQTIYPYCLGIFLAAAALFIARVYLKRQWKPFVLEALIFVFFGLMALKTVRAMAMLAFILIPWAAFQIHEIMKTLNPFALLFCRRMVIGVSVFLLAGAAFNPAFFLSPLRAGRLQLSAEPHVFQRSLFSTLAHPFVWGGLIPEVELSAQFFKARSLKGPIFNNYDIGGYLIYHLFPGERPFVDNRPEAYSGDFFTKMYVPMQEKEEVWQKVDAQYHFELIYFFRHDQTPWAQPFLLRRLDDPLWAPIFVDGYTIIFARRNGVNSKVIETYELPRSMFHSTPTGR